MHKTRGEETGAVMIHNRNHGTEKGFTLIELMIVIAIIALLAAIAVPQFMSYRQKGFNTEAKSDAKNFYTCAAAYATLNKTVTFDKNNLPDAFTGRTMIGGSFTFDSVTRVISCDARFRHEQGNVTYTVDENGNIGES